MSNECAFCLVVGDLQTRATEARTVMRGYAVCLDHAAVLATANELRTFRELLADVGFKPTEET